MPRILFKTSLALVIAFSTLAAGCGKECDKCQTDTDCAAEGLVCVRFSNGDQRCGSGLGATTCRIP